MRTSALLIIVASIALNTETSAARSQDYVVGNPPIASSPGSYKPPQIRATNSTFAPDAADFIRLKEVADSCGKEVAEKGWSLEDKDEVFAACVEQRSYGHAAARIRGHERVCRKGETGICHFYSDPAPK